MSIFQAIILGIVQGFTEFLPVSSSGHLVMFETFFGIQEQMLLTIALHLGTLIAVFVVFWKDILFLLKNPCSPLAKKLIFASVPTVIMVVLLEGVVESSFSSYFFILGFIFTAIVLFVADRYYKQKRFDISISYKSSFWIGVAQGVALFPGISRSGSTICMGLLLGEDREQVAKFSFLLSIPIILASSIYEMIFCLGNCRIAVAPMVVGMIVSLVSGIVSIKFMLNIIKKAKLSYFSIYLICIAVFLVLYFNF